MKRNLCIGLLFVVVLALLLAASSILQKRAAVEAAGVQAPRFEVDPLWPKPLTNHWLLGQTIGVSVDDKDHIWIIHRAGSLEQGELHATTNPPIAQCCAPAPPVLNYDQEGNLLASWGGRSPITESRSTTKATSGSAATASAHRRERADVARAGSKCRTKSRPALPLD